MRRTSAHTASLEKALFPLSLTASLAFVFPPSLASPRLTSPCRPSLRLASPRLASPCRPSLRLASPRLNSPCRPSLRLASPRLASTPLVAPRCASPRLATLICALPRLSSATTTTAANRVFALGSRRSKLGHGAHGHLILFDKHFCFLGCALKPSRAEPSRVASI
jgi:hypothetical protein